MRQYNTYAANRKDYSRPSEEKSSFDIFVNEMWSAYRSSIPAQANGEINLLWDPFREQWIHNDTMPSTMSPTNLIMKFTGSTDSNSYDGYRIYKNSTSDNFIDGTSTENFWPRSLLIP